MRRVRRAGERSFATLLLALAALLLAPTPSRGERFDYLYLEANAGGASGGHVAVRFGDDVYHYQNVGHSLRLIREHFDFFRYKYSVLQNRTIHASRIDVDPETYALLENRFNARHLIQEAHVEALGWRHNDVRLLEWLAGAEQPGAPEPPPLLLRGPGFFAEAAAPEASPLVALRSRVVKLRGADYLARRSAEVEEQLAALRPELAASPLPKPSADRLPLPAASFSRRVVELASAGQAIDVLKRAPPLRPGVLRVIEGSEGRLDAAERDALQALAERMQSDLTALSGSRRPDWGYPLLLGMARLLAIQASLETGQLCVLDAFPLRPRTLATTGADTRALFLGEIQEYARAELAHARRQQLARPGTRERGYNQVEAAANRYQEVQDALGHERDLRVYRDRLVPYGELPLPSEGLPELPPSDLETALGTARERERAQRRALRDTYGYGLITRNCVSEIFATINSAFAPEEVASRLGGRVETEGPLDYIPFVAFGRVTREYRLSGVGEIPSYRRARLAEMYARENPLQVYLRETNTLTSTVYRKNPDDALFLFFTDGTLWPRPIFGALNLLAGVGQTLAGLLTWPLDGGAALRAGPRGALYSLPELAFFNIRKGTLEYGRSTAHRTGLELAATPPAQAERPER